jgi:sugar O-acyltransferase (sialic acid O-acetyltransferase NeuD family)
VRIVLFGASGHASVALDIARRQGAHEVVGVLDLDRRVGSDWNGVPVLGRDDSIADVVGPNEIEGYFVAIGNNWRRAKVTEGAIRDSPSLRLVSLMHPRATVAAGVGLSEGLVVMAGAVVNPGCEIGELAIVNTGASVDHDTIIGRGVSIGPGVVMGGAVSIGACAAIGIGATLAHGITVGEHTVVGAGSTVLHDLPARVVAYGSPARVVRERVEGDPYL